MRRSRGAASLYEVHLHRLITRRRSCRQRVEHVAHEASVARGRLDEIEGGGTVHQRPALRDLRGQAATEQRSDVDAREEVARASGPARFARVVAERGVVERQLHERGECQRPVRANALDDECV